jgi:cytochrome c553
MLRACLAVLVILLPLAPASGEPRAPLCLECHRPDFPRGVLPLLEGQHAPYLRAQLARFAEGHREGFPMEGLARDLSAADIDALAEHFAAQPGRSHPAPTRAVLVERGRQRASELGCAACHGEDYRGGDSIPRLGLQAPAYIEAQLIGVREGRRYHPPTAIGTRIGDLDDGDLRALAHFIAAQE